MTNAFTCESKAFLFADQPVLRNPDSALFVGDRVADDIRAVAVFAGYRVDAFGIVRRDDDAEACAHVEDPEHLCIVYLSKPLNNQKDRRRLERFVDDEAHWSSHPSEIQKSVASDVNQGLDCQTTVEHGQDCPHVDACWFEEFLSQRSAKLG